ncbi:MAG: hypothetical protein QM699_18115 [Amaricoccus sp.]|uniref:hypothetical protein n=1 Tax=Amaricoccus sp. TaxID=1872485 RepID=UPI0039E2FC1B
MPFSRIVARITDALGTVRSASHVAAALEANERPDPAHLRRLGIDPRAFAGVGRH